MQVSIGEQLQTTQLLPDEDPRKRWFLELRRKVLPQDMFEDDACTELKQDYFKPDVVVKFEHRKNPWGVNETKKLVKGIQKHGFGSWEEISKEYFGDYPQQLIVIRASRLIGRQDMSIYEGWKPSFEELQKEFERNKALGTEQGTWKFGCTMQYQSQ
eukprot:TRINITY_DN2527_c0_g3_i2.p3 TRINITY_DN2527_c0_g3~~TRINITY_DN2527_c0_g3_i2.p3  ORF type:complete len:171 (+),score=15.04 TRINITY_DN2527_c0_g3_i2:45-515(+)